MIIKIWNGLVACAMGPGETRERRLGEKKRGRRKRGRMGNNYLLLLYHIPFRNSECALCGVHLKEEMRNERVIL